MPADPLHTTFLIADKFRSVYERMSMRLVQVFLYIAMREDSTELTQDDIGEALNCPQKTISKYLNQMVELELLKYARDPVNDSRKVVTLTSKGKKLLHDIQTIIKG